LSDAEALILHDDAARYLQGEPPQPYTLALAAKGRASEAGVVTARQHLANLQVGIRYGSHALTETPGHASWHPFSGGGPGWKMVQAPDGTLVRFYIGDWLTVSVAAAADLLMRWWPQLRPCAGCRWLYLPAHGRQRFHEAACAARVRYEKFKASRDYTAEKVRRYASDGEKPKRRRG
jgi:hypothetical protein